MRRVLVLIVLLLLLNTTASGAFWKAYSVKDFGAKGDGKTDDTDAIQRCITKSELKQYKYYKSDTAHPEIIFPAGKYLISRPIVISATRKGMNLSLRGVGKVSIRQKNPDQDIFYIHYGYRNMIENITFIGGKRQIKYFSRNYNRAQLVVRNCKFIDSSSYAIDDALKGTHHSKIVDPYIVSFKNGLPYLTVNPVDELPDIYFTSSVVHVNKCEFVNCMKVLRIFSDWAIVSDCKITTNPNMKGAAIYARGVLKVKDTSCFAKVKKANKQRFIDNINAGVMLQNVTLTTDGKTGMCPIFNRRIYDNGGLYNSYVIIADSNIKAAGSAENCFVYCEEVPNLISVTNSTETSGKIIPAIGFRQKITKKYLQHVSFPEMVKRLPELAQIYGYMVKMPRIYSISESKFKNNHSFSLYGNKGLSYTLPSVLKQFIEKPLAKNILAGFKFKKNSIIREDMKKRKTINAYSFGAKGDGKTDDTAAIQKAINAVSKKYDTELVVPGGMYRISKTLVLPKDFSIRGLGMPCFRGVKGDEILFSAKRIKQIAFTNIAFFNAKIGIDISTNAADKVKILFDHCSFSLISEAAVSCLAGKGLAGEKNNTELRITDCVYGVAGRALVSNADNALYDCNWLSLYEQAVPGSLFNKGNMQIVDIIGVPSVKSPAIWIENEDTVMVDNMRFGGEGKFKKDLIKNNSTKGKIYMKYSWLHCDSGAVILCEQIPEICALIDNLGVPVFNFHTMLYIRKQAKGKIAGHFFESGNIPPKNIIDER
jgi:Pectate lyase superfamily protein